MKVRFLKDSDLAHLSGVVSVKTKSSARYQAKNLACSYREKVICVLADDHSQIVATSEDKD